MEIQEIKQRLNILQVLAHYSLKPDKNNRLKCPFHDDKTPSLQVYPKTNTWTCFSSNCTAGSGDQIDFIMKKEGITKHQAILKAKKLISGSTDAQPAPSKRGPCPSTAKPSAINNTEVLTQAFTHFARSLNTKPKKATAYLQSRKLNYKSISIGYDAGTLHKVNGTTDKQKQEYLQAGLLKPDKFGRENSFYTRFNNCIVFPLLDKTGNIKSLYGRHVENGHHYLGGEHKGLYPCYPKEETTRLILTEAIIDAATLQQIPEITKDFTILALYGTNGFTDEHKQAIAELKELKEVILFFDGDEAGAEAANETAATLVKTLHCNVSIIDTPEGEDVNSLAQGHENDIFIHLLENRKPFSFSSEISVEKEKTTKDEPKIKHPKAGYQLKVTPDYIQYETGRLIITLWGGIEIHTVNRLRVTLHIQVKTYHIETHGRASQQSFRDTADLYSHSQTDRLIKQATEALSDSTDKASLVSTSIIKEAITGLTKELETYRQQKREEKRRSEENKEKQNIDRFSREQMQEAIDFMQSGELTKRTHQLFGNLGMIGQQDNATLLFFIFLTRFFKNPLHAIVMGSSGSGKTHLLQGVAGTVPRQHIHHTTSLSENTLYYTPKGFLKHKILLHEDLDGIYNALLAIRELMSNQEISRFSTKTNSRTGESKQIYLHVEGPVCVAGATTKQRIYEDNANRSFLIQLEENPEHEKQVLEYQGRVAAGLVNLSGQEKTIRLLKACQLLIEPMEVVIPFAPKLELPSHVFKKMRTKTHYLTLIKAITLWNQKQRKTITGKDGNHYLVSNTEDVKWANHLCKDALLRKSDELSGKTRQFFERLKDFLDKEKDTFYAKEIRQSFRLHPMQLKRHLDELEGYGLIRCRNKSYKSGNEYQVQVWDDYSQLKSGVNILDTILSRLEAENKVTH